MKLEPVIGLEIHVQLKTKSKMFCSCDNTGENQPPNTTICPVCMGHPGTLPVVNAEAVRAGIKAALALNLKVNTHSKFDRKNYFYPDLPKGYQISQYDEPLAQDGYLEVETSQGKTHVGIERLHLEEDTGKLLHGQGETLVDFNRAGTPLVEIVTKPEITSPEQAKFFLQQLRAIMKSLNVSDADMEKGHLRVDVNISLRPQGDKKLYTKIELKNLNSFRSVERGLAYEISRLTELWQKGAPPNVSTTRGWDENKGISIEQRSKEAIHDYRYFPEPDLPPLDFLKKDIDAIKKELPELPPARVARFKKEYKLSTIDAKILADDNNLSDFMEQAVEQLVAHGEDINKERAAKLTVNWLVHKLFALLNEIHKSIDLVPFTTSQFADFLMLVASRRVNSTNAQLILKQMVATGKDAEDILNSEDLGPADSADLAGVVSKVMAKYPDQVKQFQGGKEPVIKFLVGAVMKETKGKADPVEAEKVLRNTLKS
ncbi:TPA: Asp-tRNA(Asn)/Glu-tRNA(Gln) amidotransferase subunit GatB [Patescibacteria group bacterium]|nr:MAG: aspartyl/glutamyl-tRNA amidotransferase subunit B [Parcubacteria group bacterium GW2011_GWA2_46_39]HBV33151.1 Asp-tRNA(Asn)/Glu-tRNA(Gln) amidotransferase subunit GatB [Patescibacteria group bacterium]HCU48173.1 Asp-tRNA(Asn)/Glu-tRNA(Gln) amidotransferase subunit GatB [Patescibacteria group bacterium]